MIEFTHYLISVDRNFIEFCQINELLNEKRQLLGELRSILPVDYKINKRKKSFFSCRFLEIF